MGPTVALLTDFGLDDSYVGIMKAVMRRISPSVDFVDINHSIAPQNIREAAFMLLNAYRYFPPGTIFMVVVDPGVGSLRREIAVVAGEYSFVAPDNGVLSYALGEIDAYEAVVLSNENYHLQPVSSTFHGRDIFAPAAAYLAGGVSLNDFGAPVTDLQFLTSPVFSIDKDHLLGEIMHIDHFGNIISSIGEFAYAGPDTLRLKPRFGDRDQVWYFTGDRLQAEIGGQVMNGVQRSYSEIDGGQALMLIDSNGFLEIAVNRGNGAAVLGLAIGDRIEIEVK